MDLMGCFKKETKKRPISNCSEMQTSETFKRCLSNLDDDSFDGYMTMFNQVYMICEYFNNTHPIITVENVFNVCLFVVYNY